MRRITTSCNPATPRPPRPTPPSASATLASIPVPLPTAPPVRRRSSSDAAPPDEVESDAHHGDTDSEAELTIVTTPPRKTPPLPLTTPRIALIPVKRASPTPIPLPSKPRVPSPVDPSPPTNAVGAAYSYDSSPHPVPLTLSDINDVVNTMKSDCELPYFPDKIMKTLTPLFPDLDPSSLRKCVETVVLTTRMIYEKSQAQLLDDSRRQQEPLPGTTLISVPFSSVVASGILTSEAPSVRMSLARSRRIINAPVPLRRPRAPPTPTMSSSSSASESESSAGKRSRHS